MSDESTEKFEFGSPGWLAVLEDHVRRGFEQHPYDGEFSVCEVYTEPPAHLAPAGGGPLVWYLRAKDGQLEVSEGEIFDADLKHTVPYADAVYFARYDHTTADPAKEAERNARAAALRESGRTRTEVKGGDERPTPPPFMQGLHDTLARITA